MKRIAATTKKRIISSKKPAKEIAAKYGVSTSTVYRYKRGATTEGGIRVSPHGGTAKGRTGVIATGGSYSVSTDRQRESWAGFHFYNLYHNCKRKFFLKYAIGLEPEDTAYQLIGGAAFHDGKATWYKTGNHGKAMKQCTKIIKDRRGEFAEDDIYQRALHRYPLMLDSWIMTFGIKDLERYDVVMVEKEIVLPVPYTEGFLVTMRADAILKDQHGMVYVMETKSTEFSKLLLAKGVQYGDQATMYLWGAGEVLPEKPDGVIPDITYWNKKSVDSSKIEHFRDDVVTRTQPEIDDFLMGVAGTLNEISQKMLAYENGMPEEILFPRNTDRCMDFFRPCEFVDICRSKMSDLRRLPPGLKRSEKERVSITDGVMP